MLHHRDVNYPPPGDSGAPEKAHGNAASHDLDTIRNGQRLQIWSTCAPCHPALFFQGLVSVREHSRR